MPWIDPDIPFLNFGQDLNEIEMPANDASGCAPKEEFDPDEYEQANPEPEEPREIFVKIDPNETDPELIARNQELMALIEQEERDKETKMMKLKKQIAREMAIQQSVRRAEPKKKAEKDKEKGKKGDKKGKKMGDDREKSEERSGPIYSKRDDNFALVMMEGNGEMTAGGFYSRR